MDLRKKITPILIIVILLSMASCAEVKPFHQAKLQNKHMEFGGSTLEHYEHQVEDYREGTTGTQGSKTGGGCGCN